MNAPYLPDMSLRGKLRRRLVRMVARKPLPQFSGRYISFTFDDFPTSAAEAGANVLEKHDLRGTYYASTGQMGMRNHFGEISGPAHIHKLSESGHELACHTQNHVDCAANDAERVATEVDFNCRTLAGLGVASPVSFAFPYGDVNTSAKRVLGQRFTSLRGVQAGVNRPGTDANQLLSVGLEARANPVQRAMQYCKELQNSPGWLIFFTHDVREECSDWGCTPTDLEAVVSVVLDMGAQVDTVANVMAKIETGEA